MNSYLSLFFSSAYTNETLPYTRNYLSRAEYSEGLADIVLFPLRCVLGGYHITHFTETGKMEFLKCSYPYFSNFPKHVNLCFKIIDYTITFFLWIPALTLKAISWAINFSEIKKRRRLIAEAQKRDKRYELKKLGVEISRLEFSSPQHQDQSHLGKFPQVLQLQVMTFLSTEDQGKVAETCKLLNRTSKSKELVRFNENQELLTYPDFLIKILGKEHLLKLDSIEEKFRKFDKTTTRGNEGKYFFFSKRRIYSFLHALKINNEIINNDHARTEFVNSLTHARLGAQIDKCNCGDKKIFAVHVMDNRGLDVWWDPFLIVKTKNQWSFFAPKYLMKFLNDIQFDSQKPKVEEYLSRLLTGKLCGVFPPELNNPINLEGHFASDVLVEGPTHFQLAPSF